MAGGQDIVHGDRDIAYRLTEQRDEEAARVFTLDNLCRRSGVGDAEASPVVVENQQAGRVDVADGVASTGRQLDADRLALQRRELVGRDRAATDERSGHSRAGCVRDIGVVGDLNYLTAGELQLRPIRQKNLLVGRRADQTGHRAGGRTD